MFRFFHGYTPETWQAQLDHGFFGENDGVRFCQSILLSDDRKFNSLAAKGGEFHRFVTERDCPFYIDRLQGGTIIEDYRYDRALLESYGDKFRGFQMHEWLSNYRTDALKKLGELSPDDWTEQNIIKTIREKFPDGPLFLESMFASEMASFGKPGTPEELVANMTAIFEKRMRENGMLIPCDSSMLCFPYEQEQGCTLFMAEIGAQTVDTRIQICFARGVAANGGSFGAYYEPWGGKPFSACCYKDDGANEWGIFPSNFPFKTAGGNGGSSRSLQRRMLLYAFLSGAEMISEEWGVCNTFENWVDFPVSEYGKVKLDFLNFTRKYRDIGKKLAPAAAAMPAGTKLIQLHRDPGTFLGFDRADARLEKVYGNLENLFSRTEELLGTEIKNFKNSSLPDALDIIVSGTPAEKKYGIVYDLIADLDPASVEEDICKLLPCRVEGGLHWLVNERTGGGYYLTVFNHSGVSRTVADGESVLPEAEKTVRVTFSGTRTPRLLEGDGKLSRCDGSFSLTVPGGGFAFIEF